MRAPSANENGEIPSLTSRNGESTGDAVMMSSLLAYSNTLSNPMFGHGLCSPWSPYRLLGTSWTSTDSPARRAGFATSAHELHLDWIAVVPRELAGVDSFEQSRRAERAKAVPADTDRVGPRLEVLRGFHCGRLHICIQRLAVERATYRADRGLPGWLVTLELRLRQTVADLSHLPFGLIVRKLGSAGSPEDNEVDHCVLQLSEVEMSVSG